MKTEIENMTKRIIILSNSFPVKGETFLETELSHICDGYVVDIWPFFESMDNFSSTMRKGVIITHFFDLPYTFSLFAFLSSVWDLFRFKEIGEICKKKGLMGNLAKAIKFAYISELRVNSLKKWIRKERVENDTIIYSYWMYEAAFVAARIKQCYPSFKFVTRCHGYDLYCERHQNGYLPYRRYIMKYADIVYPISEHGKQYIHDCFNGQYDHKINVCRLGTTRFYSLSNSQKVGAEIVLISCSNLVGVKRIDRIIQALKISDRNITWYHFGDGELRTTLEDQAKSLPSNINYKFMGYMDNRCIQEFYSKNYVDAFINVSQSEGVPVSIMEAESYGIPVIATNVGGTSEIVHNKENGILLDVSFSDKDLLGAIDDVIVHRKRYRENALLTWEEMSNADAIYPSFYKKLVEE